MIAFLRANTAYEMKPGLERCRAQIRIVVGEREDRRMLRSAEQLHRLLRCSVLEIKTDMRHGEYCINHPGQYVKDLLENV